MNDKYSLDGLTDIFIESNRKEEPTLVFEIKNGKGRFLFMMFFDYEDETSKDYVFIFMKNISKMLKLKLYGNHEKGQFYIYLSGWMKDLFKKELLIETNNPAQNLFEFDRFFNDLNLAIPKTLSLSQKIYELKNSWNEVKKNLPKDIIDDEDKTILIGDVKLPPNKRPQEKTLRKLYLYADGNPEDIAELINRLKSLNRTVAWTNDINRVGKSTKTII